MLPLRYGSKMLPLRTPTHRSIQDANYHNQIVKDQSGAPSPGQGSTGLSKPSAEADGTAHGVCLLQIDRGRTRFALARALERTCNRTRPLAIRSAIFYRSTNQQSVALAAIFCKTATRRSCYQFAVRGSTGPDGFSLRNVALALSELDFIASSWASKGQKLFYAYCGR